MLFNVEADLGSRVVAYLVLDDFSAVPRMLVTGGGSEREVEANEIREALVQAGRHQTGRCGFRIEAKTVPEISAPDLELREANTGVLIYRRRPPGMIDQKILRLETGLLPLWRFDSMFTPLFQYAMTRIEHHGRETITQMFLMNQVSSQYISGRILYKNFEYFIQNSFKVWICMHNPYEELAERLLVLKSLRKVGLNLLSERDRIHLRGTIEFAENLPLDDQKTLKRALRNMPEEAATKLSNPLIRLLTASNLDEMPSSGGSIPGALDVLASCELVGFHKDLDAFASAAARGLDLPEQPAYGERAVPAHVQALAERLRDCGAIERILDKDLELFYYIEQAARTAESREDV